MEIRETGIEGLVEIYPKLFHDDRGFFYEFYKEPTFKAGGVSYTFVQENQSFSRKGVVRGLHMQLGEYAQAKLVACLYGKVLDVVVDLRPASKTFGKVFKRVLDGTHRNMLMVPDGFAHGFAALEESIVHYKCSNIWNKESESGVVYNDPELNIDWEIKNPLVSEKDLQLPTLAKLLKHNLTPA